MALAMSPSDADHMMRHDATGSADYTRPHRRPKEADMPEAELPFQTPGSATIEDFQRLDMRVGRVRAAVAPGNLAPLVGLGEQLLLGVGVDLDRTQQIEAAVDQLLGVERASRLQAVDDAAHARCRGVADLFGHEVDARHQGAAVDPLLAGVPAFDRWRVQQILTHIGGMHR